MYRYFYSAIFLHLWSLHAYFNYYYPSTWLDREINRSRDFHQIKLCIENVNRLLQFIMLLEVHSSDINSIELSASSSNMWRSISDFCLLNDLYICLPIYKAWNFVWGCVYYSLASATFGIIPTHLVMHDVRCLVSPSPAFCSSHLDNSLLLVELADIWWIWACDACCEKSVLETLKHLEIM